MNYKEKLIQFNSTEKYRTELRFLYSLVGNDRTYILDYGCGIGTAVKYISDHTGSIVRGYDVQCHLEQKHNWFLEYPPNETYGHIYFMHSLAHIADIEAVLVQLQNNLLPVGRITVITPNLDWIEKVGNTYSDPTVVRHFTSESLKELFEKTGYKIIQQGQFGEVKDSVNERLFIQVCKGSSL